MYTAARCITVGKRYCSIPKALSFFSRGLAASSTSNIQPTKIAVLGAGSFGSAMVKVLSQSIDTSTRSSNNNTSNSISWYARRQSIVDEINTLRTNAQYFGDGHFPENVVSATTDLSECLDQAQVVVVSVPSQFLPPLLEQCVSQRLLHPSAVLVSVIKSLHYNAQQQTLTTAIDDMKRILPNHPAVALSGPNLYKEMTSDDSFAEATLGYDDKDKIKAQLVQTLLQSRNFQTSLCNDRQAVELCGGLKNVLSLAVGYCEGLEMGWNVRAAILRAGMHEMERLIHRHVLRQKSEINSSNISSSNTSSSSAVFQSSAGMGDVILTCTAGRGRLLAADFVRFGQQHGRLASKQDNIQRWDQLEQDLLNGMKLPDWHNAQYVHQALVDWKCPEEFPLLTCVHQIGFEGADPRECLIEAVRQSIRKADC